MRIDIESFNHLNGVYEEIAAAFNLETALKFYAMFKGQQITFPMHLFSKEYIVGKIRTEYNGYNLKQLSKKYGYSERWVREILRGKWFEQNDLKEKNEMENQLKESNPITETVNKIGDIVKGGKSKAAQKKKSSWLLW